MYKAHKTHKAAFTAHLRGASTLPLRLDAGNTRKSVPAASLTRNLLDRRYTNVVTFAMLARPLSPGHLPTSANSFTAILLQPLGALFRPSPLYNQQFTDSFVEIGGVGYPRSASQPSSAQAFRRATALCPSCVFTNLQIPQPASPLPSPFVFITLRIPFPATPLFSQPSELPGVSPLPRAKYDEGPASTRPQTLSAIFVSMRWKKNSPPISTSATPTADAAIAAPGGCPWPVSAHRNPSITPAIGFSP